MFCPMSIECLALKRCILYITIVLSRLVFYSHFYVSNVNFYAQFGADTSEVRNGIGNIEFYRKLAEVPARWPGVSKLY